MILSLPEKLTYWDSVLAGRESAIAERSFPHIASRRHQDGQDLEIIQELIFLGWECKARRPQIHSLSGPCHIRESEQPNVHRVPEMQLQSTGKKSSLQVEVTASAVA